ncbi:MAG: lipid-A-disaccharide synthase [Bacteroidaceae bacterium]|nr:lipid-A-disaccharide synthase [Bacteroidaceae bacterium]
MKYFLIAGEASGDLHASHLMQSLRQCDAQAEFRCIGGDLMAAQGGHLVRHYSTLAYMGILPVIAHLPTILRGMRECRSDILRWQPDTLILVDYPGFNLSMAKYIRRHAPGVKIFYYISPKIWAWKEWRIRDIRANIDQLYSILPFEVDYFRQRHRYDIRYVGNPTLDEVSDFEAHHPADFSHFIEENHLPDRPVIALLAGSRQQEIRDNLSRMLRAAAPVATDYQLVVAGAPGIEPSFYAQFIDAESSVRVLYGQTYPLLQHATAALVTSGTATLETALFRVPQVVCYYIGWGKFISFMRRLVLKIPYISLVNLIADREVVPELVADGMTVENVRRHLQSILPGGSRRAPMLRDYEDVALRLGQPGAPQRAADHMFATLHGG